MPKKLYLTTTLPSTSAAVNLPTDVKLKLREYGEHQSEYRNEPPQVDPYPIEKYSVHKEKTAIRASDIPKRKLPSEKKAREETISLDSYPNYMHNKILRILPHFKRLKLIDEYGKDVIKDILYDLFAKGNRLRTKNVELLNSIIRTLQADSTVPKIYRQIGYETAQGSAQQLNIATPARDTRSPRQRSQSMPRSETRAPRPRSQSLPRKSFQKTQSWI